MKNLEKQFKSYFDFSPMTVKKGENRYNYFMRMFKGCFTAKQLFAVKQFMNKNAYQPLFPIYKKRGCYLVSAYKYFKNNKKLLLAVWFADRIQDFPEVQVQIQQIISNKKLMETYTIN